MAAGFFIFSAVDTQAKFLTQTLHPIQIVWTRQLGLLIGVLFLLRLRGLAVLRTKTPLLQMSRGALAATSATLFIVGVSFVPLADAVAISFVAPFFVTMLGALILREPVGIRRWTAIIVGFGGTLIVIRPGLGVIHPGALLVMLAAFLFALRQILSRMLSGGDRTETTVAYTALTGSALLTLPLPFFWHWPETSLELGLLAGIALLAALGEFLIIRALEVGQAVVVAPMQYSMMIWGTFYGFVVFGDFPDFWTWVGAAVIVASGIYTFYRERQVMKNAKT